MGTTGLYIAAPLTGRTFHRLTVLARSSKKNNSSGHVYWDCRCQCGNLTTVCGKELRRGRTKSCGCLSAEANRRSRKQAVPKVCRCCGATYVGRIWSRYCSKKCAWREDRVRNGKLAPKVTLTCPMCDKAFLRTSANQEFCSPKCNSQFRYREKNQQELGLRLGILEGELHGGIAGNPAG